MSSASISNATGDIEGDISKALQPVTGQDIQHESDNPIEQPFNLINAEGVPNLRGFGGYPSGKFGTTQTRKGILYRSAHPGGMTEVGLRKLKMMGIRYIVDLTSQNETTVPYNLPADKFREEGLTRINCPLENKAFSVEDLLAKYDTYMREGSRAVSRSYSDLLQEGAEAIRTILALLKDNPDGAFLIHCSLGKDRTGVIFALLFLLMEVPEPVIAREYSLSSEGLASCVSRIEKYVQEKTENGHSAKQRALAIVTARCDTITYTIEAIRIMHGGAHGYLTHHCGLSESDIMGLVSILAEPER